MLQSVSSNLPARLAATLKVVLIIGMMTLCCAGCHRARHKQLPEGEIHRITREFVFAANSTAPTGSEIHGEVGAFDKVANSADHIEIRIFEKREGKTYPASVNTMLQKFNGIATAHQLTQDNPTENGNAIVVNYRHAGFISHIIHIHLLGDDEASEQKSVPTASENRRSPRLAIILDDLGNDRRAAEAVFAMPYPVTLSILPKQAHSKEIAEQAHKRGYQAMLHLPMQSIGKEHAEAQELRPGMSSAEVSRLVTQFLNELPGVAGVNNHQGSESTGDPRLMAELMPVLREHKLFYVDSRTSTATVAYDTAQKSGVPAAFRNVPFLDDDEEVAAVRKQIKIAIAVAAKQKEAVAIGHARPATLEALRQTLPQAQSYGVKLVFASELAR